MEIEDYPDNRRKPATMPVPLATKQAYSKPDAPKKQDHKSPVVGHPANVKKPTLGDKIKDSFKPEDLTQVRDYVILDIIIPKFKDACYSMIIGTIDSLFGIKSSPTVPASRYSYSKPINYSAYSSSSQKYVQKDPSYSSNTVDYDEIEYATRDDAEAVLNGMQTEIEEYGSISILEMYELSGTTDNNYTHNNYGWESLDGAQIVRIPGNKYGIRLPRPRPLQ